MSGEAQVEQLIEFMDHVHGRDLSRYDPSFLQKTLRGRLEALGLPDLEAYARHLTREAGEAMALWNALAVGFSEFFRDPLTFALLEQVVLPTLLDEVAQLGRTDLRVWSAACAGGQEAYSVAMLLEDQCAARGQDFCYRIFATDICHESLGQGEQGVYEAGALQNLRLRHLRGYFLDQGQRHQVIPRLRLRVDFSAYDLLDQRLASPPASIYGDFDLVMCSNLLFYYRPDTQNLILEKAVRSLRAGGCLITGQAERSLAEQNPGLRPLALAPAVFRKTAA